MLINICKMHACLRVLWVAVVHLLMFNCSNGLILIVTAAAVSEYQIQNQ